MYGIIIEGVRLMIVDNFGPAVWQQCLEKSQLHDDNFATHERYSEKIIPNLITAVAEITGKNVDEIGIAAGKYFIHYICKFGYNSLLQVLGRRYADFLRGLDNLHEYFRLSYTKLKPPSFYCEKEDINGLVLHYRSRRQGFISYVVGQLMEIARLFYDLDVEIQVLKKEQRRHVQYTVLRINFNNSDHKDDQKLQEKCRELTRFLPIETISFLEMFPYHIAFNKNMEIISAGGAIKHLMPALEGSRIDQEFNLIRPFVRFTPEGCKHHINNAFQFESYRPVFRKDSHTIAFQINDEIEEKIAVPTTDEEKRKQEAEHEGVPIVLKGQMAFLKESDTFLYFGTCLIESLDQMFTIGLFLNDYNISDCNRDIIMASVQKSDSMKELLKEEREKSRQLARNLKECSVLKKRARELLSELMPKQIANEFMRNSKAEYTNICEGYEETTVCFVRIVDFARFQQDVNPTNLVQMLNAIISKFDSTVERHGVYKRVRHGFSNDDFYMIASGVPIRTPYHAEYVCDVALDFVQNVRSIKDEATGRSIEIKIGMHSGPLIGGIIGAKVPRFCLFGETVRLAAKVEEANDEPMTILVGSTTRRVLEKNSPRMFKFKSRGVLGGGKGPAAKGKAKDDMEMFEVQSKKGGPRSQTHPLIEAEHDSDASDVYTPIEEREAEGSSMMSSAMSRISIEASVTVSSGTPQSSRNPSRAGGEKKEDLVVYNSRSIEGVEVKEENIPLKVDEDDEEPNGATDKQKLAVVDKPTENAKKSFNPYNDLNELKAANNAIASKLGKDQSPLPPIMANGAVDSEGSGSAGNSADPSDSEDGSG